MATPPKIFVSATSGDLRTARVAVRDALLTIECHPVEQTTFGPDYRTVRQMLEEKLRDCQALIHIVGLRYGAEPDPASLPPGTSRRSYTQLEYDLGRALAGERGDKGFRVYTFVCSEGFPYDAAASEPPEKRALQDAHRQAILTEEVIYETPATIDALRAPILALQEQAIPLRVEQEDLRTDVRKILELLADKTTQRVAGGENLTPEQRFERVLEEIAEQKGVQVVALRGAIDSFIAGVKANPHAGFLDRALADFAAQEFAAAAENAERAAKQAQARRRQKEEEAAVAAAEERSAWKLAGDAYYSEPQYEDALAAYRSAAGLTDRQADPLAWADANTCLAAVLSDLARYAEAEPLLRDILAMREAHQSPSAPEIAFALGRLAILLKATNRLVEAEPFYRRTITILEQSYGPEHPMVGASLGNLGMLLGETNRLAEAEPLFRRALAIFESYGPGDPLVATGLNNLAWLLQGANRLAEAEPLFRRALAIDEQSYGPNHPVLARDLNNLAKWLELKDRPAEAEPLFRRAVAIDEKNYGANHPEVATGLNNLAWLLQATNRLAEAERLFRRALGILVLSALQSGHDHSHLKPVRGNYVACLEKQGRTQSEITAELRAVDAEARAEPG